MTHQTEQAAVNHYSAVALTHLGSTLFNLVPDSDQREAIVERICVMLEPGDQSVFRSMAGLPGASN